MNGVAAGLEDQVHGAARVATSLRSRLRLRREFIDRVNRQDDTGNARDATLVHSRDVVPEIVVVYAINLPVYLVRAGAVDRSKAAHRITSIPGRNRDQLGKVTPIEGNVLNHG